MISPSKFRVNGKVLSLPATVKEIAPYVIAGHRSIAADLATLSPRGVITFESAVPADAGGRTQITVTRVA